MSNPEQQPLGPREDIVIRRIIEAPIDAAWAAWTEPEHVKRWWGPKYYSSPWCRIDLREGGSYLFCMKAPPEQGGAESYTGGTYTRIVPKRLLEFTQTIADRDGNPLDPSQAGAPPEFPKEMRTTVELEELGELTRLTVTIRGWTMSQMFVFAFAGWHQQMDKLEESLGRR